MSQRARHRRAARRGGVGKKLVAGMAVLLGVAALAAGAAAFWVLDVAASAPDIATLKPASDGANSEVFDADGNSLGYVQSDILREPAKLKQIPLTLQQATIAIEDESFYDHSGVDYAAIVRAAIENAEAGEVRQGASTITQQLVRNLYIDEPEDTIERKIREAEMAREYEQTHSKQEILEEYLNTATYGTTDGRSAIGVAAAAEVFFNKSLRDLGLREVALLAGLPQAPTDYNPYLNPDLAKQRRNQVLNALAKQGYITQEKADRAKEAGLGLERGNRYEKREEPFFFDYVQQELIDRYGLRKVRQGGLKIYTTLVPEYQAAAVRAIADHPVYGAASALVSTDTQTGEILAMASSQAYDASQFNLAAQGERQPGSSFKPFVLTAAVDQGMDPDSTSYPAPGSISLTPDPGMEPWQVNGGGKGGSMTLRAATAGSVNTVYAQLGIDVGPANFVEMAHKLGVKSKLNGYYAEALGGTETCCTVLEMSNAYATLANGGIHHDPTAIRKVEFPNGKEDKPKNPEGERVISDGVAYTVADVMQGTLDYGTAAGHDLPGCTASGKTGTTELNSDAWFVGYTPDVSTAVWTGNPDSRTPLPGYGADLSAPIWHDYMMVAATKGCRDFPEPKDPADLSAYSSSQTRSSDYDSDSSDSTEETTDEDGNVIPTDPTTDGVDSDGDGYPDDAYAPGVGQEPER